MKKYVVVTGGQLFNKGAQAMTFITADEVARRYPEREVIVLSNKDFRRSEEEKQKYTFRIMQYPKTHHLMMMQTKLGRALYKLFGGKTSKEFVRLMENAAAVVDISGYALGANWGYKKTFIYLTRLGIAHSAGVPVYLMPQSFGPFNYKGILAAFVHGMMRKNLRYANVIMCREKEGYEELQRRYKLENLILTPDLVLQNTGIDIKNVYNQKPEWTLPVISDSSVAVIPNQKTMKYGNAEQLLDMYQQIIEALLKHDKKVYLIYHSTEDLSICCDIKEKHFRDRQSVVLVEKELSCLEFDEVVKCFDFIVASRFHAVVHSFRNAVPAIVPGWAIKYQELLDLFSQGRFMFDVRGQIKVDDIVNAIHEMCDNHKMYSKQIESGLVEIREKNVYDYIKL